jgi:hypothetical protein
MLAMCNGSLLCVMAVICGKVGKTRFEQTTMLGSVLQQACFGKWQREHHFESKCGVRVLGPCNRSHYLNSECRVRGVGPTI